jgi:hypothetical protein
MSAGSGGTRATSSVDFDPERRPPNAFILFSRSVRPSIQSKHPGINNIECTRILAQAWKLLPEEEQLIFKGMAAELQTRFKEKNPHYTYGKSRRRSAVAVAIETARASDRRLDDHSCPFRWDMMLNHHDDTANKIYEYSN